MAYAIKKGSDYFNTVLYTGNGSTNAITVGFQPDFIWIKRRNGSPSDSNMIQDSVRGLDKFLITNGTFAEQSQNDSDGVTSYDTNGFTLGYTDSDAWNSNSNTYVAWNWRGSDSAAVTNTNGSITSQVSANPTAGFSIVTWTGNGSNGATVGHGLGNAPEWVIVKRRDSSGDDWLHYHQSLGATKSIAFDTAAAITSSTRWNNTAPSSSLITLGTSTGVNGSGATYVAYCWSEIAGFSKFGSYTGNGSADGTFVYTGFRPAVVLVKRTDGVQNWTIYDSVRDTDNVVQNLLVPNTSGAETTYGIYDFLSNGFKLRNTDTAFNGSGANYIYMAFAETPMKFANAR